MRLYKYHGKGIDKENCESETVMEKLVEAEIKFLTAKRWVRSLKQLA